MLPKLTPIQNQYLEEKYGRALDKAEESLALAIATDSKAHVQNFETSIAVARVLFELGNFEEDPRYREM